MIPGLATDNFLRTYDDLPIDRPWLRQRTDQIRPLFGENVIHQPTARNLAFASFGCGVETEEGNDIAGICVEHLFICRVGRCADRISCTRARQILDMRQDHRATAWRIPSVFLAAADIPDV